MESMIDTTKTVITKDTIIFTNVSENNKIQQHTTVETTIVKGGNDCWFNICDCKLLSDIFWPLTVLIIAYIFKKHLKSLIEIIGDRIRKGHSFKIGPGGMEIGEGLNTQEVSNKAEKEFEEFENTKDVEINISDGGISITKDEFIPKYIQIERRIFELLMKSLYPSYRILSNRKIQGYEYDLIIETSGEKEYDYIIEVKYFPSRFNQSSLINISIKLDFLVQVYKNTVKRIAKPILIIVLNKEIDIQYDDTLNYINQPFVDKKYIKMLIINQYEIETVDRQKIINLLEA